MIKVLLADDQSLVRSGFRMLIDSADDMETVGEVSNGADAVTVVKTQPVDVVLMDIRMPVMDGTEATRQITELGGDTKVLVLTTSTAPTWFLRRFCGNYVGSVFLGAALKQLGMRGRSWVNFGKVGKVSRRQHKKHLKNVARLVVK